MTGQIGDVNVSVVPRVYGANELGVLALTAPGAAHPRVEYVGGELFVGLVHLRDGAAVTQGESETWSPPFRDALSATVPGGGPLPEPIDGVTVVEDEPIAASVLVEPSRTEALAVIGAPVVFALSRHRVAIVGADDEAGVARILRSENATR